jgi:hypothetical protein
MMEPEPIMTENTSDGQIFKKGSAAHHTIDYENARVPQFVADMMLRKQQDVPVPSRNPLQKIITSNQMKSTDHYWMHAKKPNMNNQAEYGQIE